MRKGLIIKLSSIAVLLLSAFITLTKINFFDYESPIGYDRIAEITFKNFRGLEFFQNSIDGNKQFAYIKTTIDYDIEKDSVEIQSYFHPSSSYVYNNNVFSKELLTHEMYHFKIAELFVRIAKKRISEYNKISQKEITGIISEIKMEEKFYQIQYDDDTYHSYVLSEQKKYENEIDSLLNLHENFKNHKLHINEK